MKQSNQGILKPIQQAVRHNRDDLWWRRSLDFEFLHHLMVSELTGPKCRLVANYDLQRLSKVAIPPLTAAVGAHSSDQLRLLKIPDLNVRGFFEQLFTRVLYSLRVDSPGVLPGALKVNGGVEAPLRSVVALDARNCCYARLDFVGRAAVVSTRHRSAVQGLGFEYMHSPGPSDLTFLNRRTTIPALLPPLPPEEERGYQRNPNWWR